MELLLRPEILSMTEQKRGTQIGFLQSSSLHEGFCLQYTCLDIILPTMATFLSGVSFNLGKIVTP